MNSPKELTYNSDFTLNFYYAEIEKYKSVIQKINEPKNLVFEEIRNSINQSFTNQSIKYVGNYLIYSIRENNEIIGTLECFKNNENDYFNLFTLNK